MSLGNARIILYLIMLFNSLLFACRSDRKGTGSSQKHTASVHEPGGKSIYIDHVANNRLLSSASTNSESIDFYSLEVTFLDSSNAEHREKDKSEWIKYFQYEMQDNWKLVDNRDSINPVFFQPLLKRTPQNDAGILVFEVNKGSKPDTLTYNDQFSNKKQVFILKD